MKLYSLSQYLIVNFYVFLSLGHLFVIKYVYIIIKSIDDRDSREKSRWLTDRVFGKAHGCSKELKSLLLTSSQVVS